MKTVTLPSLKVLCGKQISLSLLVAVGADRPVAIGVFVVLRNI